MSVQQELGISESEWQQLDDQLKRKLISNQAKITADRLISANQMLEDDDKDIRERQKNVQKSLLSQDTTDCEDTPYEAEDMQPSVNYKVLGDLTINGDEAVKNMQVQQQATDQSSDSSSDSSTTQTQVTDTRVNEPRRGINPLWPLIAGAGLSLGGMALYRYLYPPQAPDLYTIQALPFESFPGQSQ